MTKKLSIEGMTCGHCVKHVEEALNELDGVISAKANLAEKNVLVDLSQDINESVFKDAMKEYGYELVGIQNL